MTEVATVTARIVAIADDMTGITASDEYPADIRAVLPFCLVEEGTATFEKTDTNNLRTTQEWGLLFYVRQFNEEVTNEADDAYQAVRPYLNSVALYFSQRTRLQRNDQGLTDIVSSWPTGHEGITSADRNNITYMGVRFPLSVVYDTYISEI